MSLAMVKVACLSVDGTPFGYLCSVENVRDVKEVIRRFIRELNHLGYKWKEPVELEVSSRDMFIRIGIYPFRIPPHIVEVDVMRKFSVPVEGYIEPERLREIAKDLRKEAAWISGISPYEPKLAIVLNQIGRDVVGVVELPFKLRVWSPADIERTIDKAIAISETVTWKIKRDLEETLGVVAHERV